MVWDTPWHELDEIDKKILMFFWKYQKEHGQPPTVREIERGVGLSSTSHVKYHLDHLVDHGFLKRRQDPGKRRTSRAYRLNLPPVLPVLGYIIAGDSIRKVFAEDFTATSFPFGMEVEDVVSLDSIALPGALEDYFALRVRGDSMIDEHILDGDVVVFRKLHGQRPEKNSLVAVLIDHPEEGETLMLKRYAGPVPGNPRLLRFMPANRAKGLQPIDVPEDRVRFQGKAVLLVRHFDMREI